VFKFIVLSIFCVLTVSVMASHPGVTTGNEYLKIKNYEKSLKSFSDVLLENSKNKEALYGKSYTLLKMKKYEDALASFQVLLTIDKNYKDALYRTAFLYRKAKKYDKAIEHYKLYLNKVKDDPDSYYGLARTSEKKKDIVYASYYFYLYTTKETRESEDKWIKKAQKKIEKYRAKFNANQQSQYDKLINKPALVPTAVAVTEVKAKTSEKDVAVKVEKLPTKAEASTIKVEKLPSKVEKVPTKVETEIPVLSSTEKKQSGDKNLNYMFKRGVEGDDLYLSKKYNEAIVKYRAYLKDSSNRREGLYKMAVCNAMLKKYPTAVRLFSQIILEEKNDKNVKQLLKLVLINKTVISSLKGATTSVKTKIGMGKVAELVGKGDYYEAIKILDLLIANIKNSSNALLYKVDLLRILSKTKEIDLNLKSFLTKNPNNVLINEKYGDFLSSQNKKSEALSYYKTAISKCTDKDVKKRLESKISE